MKKLDVTQTGSKIFGVQKAETPTPKVRYILFKPLTMLKENNTITEFKNKKRSRIHLLNRENNNDDNFREGRWEEDEHQRFIKSCLTYGNNWRKVNNNFKYYKVQNDVVTRSAAQIRSHAQKFILRLCRKNFISPKRKPQAKQHKDEFKNGPLKISTTALHQLTDDEKRILEIFHVLNKENVIEDNYYQNFLKSENCDSNSILEDSPEFKNFKFTIPQIRNKKRKGKIFENPKKNLFKIEKQINSSKIHFGKFKEDLLQMISYNNKIILDLLNFNSIEDDTKYLTKWIQDNNNYSNNNLYINLNLQSFLENMNNTLYKMESLSNIINESNINTGN